MGESPPEKGGLCGGERSSNTPRASVMVKWVCTLAKPGMTILPVPSTLSAPAWRARISALGPIAVMRSPSMAMAAPWWSESLSSTVAITALWMTMVTASPLVAGRSWQVAGRWTVLV